MSLFDTKNQGLRRRKEYSDSAAHAAYNTSNAVGIGSLSPRGDEQAIIDQNNRTMQNVSTLNNRYQGLLGMRNAIKPGVYTADQARRMGPSGLMHYRRSPAPQVPLQGLRRVAKPAPSAKLQDGYFESLLGQYGIDNNSLYNAEQSDYTPDGAMFRDTAQSFYAQGASPEEAGRRAALALVQKRDNAYQAELAAIPAQIKQLQVDPEVNAQKLLELNNRLSSLPNIINANKATLLKLNQNVPIDPEARQAQTGLNAIRQKVTAEAQRQQEARTGLRYFINNKPKDADGNPLQIHSSTSKKWVGKDGAMHFSLGKGLRMTPSKEIDADVKIIDAEIGNNIQGLQGLMGIGKNQMSQQQQSDQRLNQIVQKAEKAHSMIFEATGSMEKADEGFKKIMGMHKLNVQNIKNSKIADRMKRKQIFENNEDQIKYTQLMDEYEKLAKIKPRGLMNRHSYRKALMRRFEIESQIKAMKEKEQSRIQNRRKYKSIMGVR